MRFIQSQPDAQSPSWGSAFGLFSFQIGAVIITSGLIGVVPGLVSQRFLLIGIFTMFAAFLYAHLSESQVPGALRVPRCRRILAQRAAGLTGSVALLQVIAFHVIDLNLAGLSRTDPYVVVFLLGGLFVVPWLELWCGLTVAVRLRRKGS